MLILLCILNLRDSEVTFRFPVLWGSSSFHGLVSLRAFHRVTTSGPPYALDFPLGVFFAYAFVSLPNSDSFHGNSVLPLSLVAIVQDLFTNGSYVMTVGSS